VPDIPASILAVAAGAVLDLNLWGSVLDRMDTRQRAEVIATAVLNACAEPLGEHCAARIAEHAGRQHPRDPSHVPTAWDRHMGIAARVAAGAFLDDADMLRIAAREIAAGNFAVCQIPEVPGG
jgi:hypothetical protein